MSDYGGLIAGTSDAPLKLMFDSMVFDVLIDSSGALEAFRAASDAGRVQAFTTHVQEDQLADAPEGKQARFAEVPRTCVPSSVFIVGVSRLGQARLGRGAVYSKVRTDQGHFEDAIIGETAVSEEMVLITDDRRLTRRLREAHPSLEIWTSHELLASLLA